MTDLSTTQSTHLSQPAESTTIQPLDPTDAATALHAAGKAARGFLGLDPVTQNEPLLAAELVRLNAMVFRYGDTVVGYVPNTGQPRQGEVATTSAKTEPVRALLAFLDAYRRCTSFVAMVPAGAQAGTAFTGCGFSQVGTLRGHRFQSGGYHDVLVYAGGKPSCHS
ncbi:MAG TPA: hypothetical protein VM677_21015 [Actinokineospora sp.]|nr:hypothetical protein [Actinokineospora sp.]